MSDIRTPSGLREIKRISVRNASNVLKEVMSGHVRNASNVLKDISGIGAIVATASPTDVYGYGNSHGTIIISTSSSGVTVVGGATPYTYDWQIDTGAFEPITPSSQFSAFRTTGGVGPGDGETGSAFCVVTDADGRTANSNIVNLNVQNLGS